MAGLTGMAGMAAGAVAALSMSLAVGITPAQAAPGGDRLGVDEQLELGGAGQEFLESANGQHRLEFEDQGEGDTLLLQHFGITPVWSPEQPALMAGARLIVQGDGNVVLYNTGNAFVWSSGTTSTDPVELVLQNDGNLVLYNTVNNAVLWFTGETPSYMLSAPSEGATALAFDDYLVSADRRYQLVMQGDGNLVQYGPGGALWSTETEGSTGQFVVQEDGNLVVYAEGRAVWQSGTGAPVTADDPVAFELVLQDDANLVLYAYDLAEGEAFAIWSSARGRL